MQRLHSTIFCFRQKQHHSQSHGQHRRNLGQGEPHSGNPVGYNEADGLADLLENIYFIRLEDK